MFCSCKLFSAGVGTLLAATLAITGWNFAQHAIHYWPVPGTTAFNYVGKPLAWVLPLGLPAAALLGAVPSRRIWRAS